MTLLASTPLTIQQTQNIDLSELTADIVEQLRHWFAVEFSIWDAEGKCLQQSLQQPLGDETIQSELIRAVSGKAEPQFLADEDSVLLLAIPLVIESQRYIACRFFTTRQVADEEQLTGPQKILGLNRSDTQQWINSQTTWSADSLLRLASAVSGKMNAEAKTGQLTHEVDKLSQCLSASYEEISLLYGVTKKLRISTSDEELGKQALDWISECIAAKGFLLQLLPVEEEGVSVYDARTISTMLTFGECPIDENQFNQLIEKFQLSSQSEPAVANLQITSKTDWMYPEIRQLIIVPLYESDNLFGWLVAINHRDDLEFGTVEASLLRSVGALLGVHSGNHELYRQQAEFMAGAVRALTSAIDAKDPYTCGHSDRVARVSVHLAQHLGSDEKMLSTIYMGGLLHDIGKIGVQDSVLRKPGRLTDAEYEQIKLHPQLGYNILVDLKQFSEMLPIVLHHHEEWDGTGYPHQLAGHDIPYMARITAVADAYDAMTSDRPYRKGMSLGKVNDVFRKGRGKQWDPEVIDAYFATVQGIQKICQSERANLTINVQKWV